MIELRLIGFYSLAIVPMIFIANPFPSNVGWYFSMIGVLWFLSFIKRNKSKFD